MDNRKIYTIFVVAASLLLSACGQIAPNSLDGNNTQSASVASLPVNAVEWETTGGGDLQFTMDSVDSKSIRVQVTRFQFHNLNKTLHLTLQKDPDLYRAVLKIFSRKNRIVTETGNGGYAGSWTTITLILQDSTVERVLHPKAADQSQVLNDLYAWVTSNSQ